MSETIMGCVPAYVSVFGIKLKGPQEKRPNPYKWLEYAISATIGGFAVAWVNGDPGISFQAQLLLAAAGVAQQASGYQLELRWDSNDDKTLPGEIVSFGSAFMLQVGEFAVVWLALKDGLDLNPGASTDATWLAYSSYVIGYLLFGVLMLMFLVFRQNNHDIRENIYSVGGLVAKLGLLWSEFFAYRQEIAGSWITCITVALLSAFLVYLSHPAAYSRTYALVE